MNDLHESLRPAARLRGIPMAVGVDALQRPDDPSGEAVGIERARQDDQVRRIGGGQQFHQVGVSAAGPGSLYRAGPHAQPPQLRGEVAAQRRRRASRAPRAAAEHHRRCRRGERRPPLLGSRANLQLRGSRHGVCGVEQVVGPHRHLGFVESAMQHAGGVAVALQVQRVARHQRPEHRFRFLVDAVHQPDADQPRMRADTASCDAFPRQSTRRTARSPGRCGQGPSSVRRRSRRR